MQLKNSLVSLLKGKVREFSTIIEVPKVPGVPLGCSYRNAMRSYKVAPLDIAESVCDKEERSFGTPDT